MSDQNGFEFQRALTAVLNTQAATQQTVAIMLQAQAETAHRFLRIESELAAIRAILVRHEELLRALPEAVRSKIGFQETTP